MRRSRSRSWSATRKPLHDGCRILYRDIGDYLRREEKLAVLREAGSIAGIEDWRTITPDRHHDWIGQRSEEFQKLYPVGSKAAKAGRTDEAIFKLYSNGYKTGRDAYVYNFSRDACTKNARKNGGRLSGCLAGVGRIQEWITHGRDHSRDHTPSFLACSVGPSAKGQLGTAQGSDVFAGQRMDDPVSALRQAALLHRLRPDTTQVPDGQYFPCVRQRKPCDLRSGNRIDQAVLGARGRYDAGSPLSTPFGQCFPRYRYRERAEVQRELPGIESGRERIDNISDTALRAFRVRYNDNTITKDAIFDYVYGVLHASAYRERFANDLAKELPRIPLAPDFHAFAKAGRELAELHLGYETCAEYPLEIVFAREGEPRPAHFRIGDRAMRFADDEKTVLAVNEHVSLRGIPDLAHTYQVNGRTPLEWFIDRYRITQDQKSGIVNDPNGWFDDPRDLIAAIRRIVHVSMEIARIVTGLPEPMRADFPAGGRAL